MKEEGTPSPRKGARKRVSTNTEEDSSVIELDDTETPSPGKRKPGARALRSDSKLQEREKLCEFPLGESPNITITFQVIFINFLSCSCCFFFLPIFNFRITRPWSTTFS